MNLRPLARASGIRRLLAAVLVVLAAACGPGNADSPTDRPPPAYSLEATSACLQRQMDVTAIGDDDDRLAALSDLAQKNSIQAGTGDQRVGIAFARTPGEAHLLADLLVVPADTHRLVVKVNAVFVYPPTAGPTFEAATACLTGEA